MQKTISFILPIIEDELPVWENLENVYIGDVKYEGDEWGNNIYLLYKNISSSTLDGFRRSKRYKTEYDPKPGYTMIVLAFTKEEKESIVKPFCRGEYSKLPLWYKSKHFKKHNPSGDVSTNWRIVNRDPVLRDYWKSRGVEVPPTAEYWSRPEKHDEIYGFTKKEEYAVERVVVHN